MLASVDRLCDILMVYLLCPLQAGMETAAAFFESRRYAAMKGATMEWSKAEGLAFDPATLTLYVAISTVRYSMVRAEKRGNGCGS